MPARRLSMRKIREVLRLKLGLGLTDREIARSCSIPHSSVANYLARAKGAGLECKARLTAGPGKSSGRFPCSSR
jgi:DNA-directed RNA polymerase specialized sigma24 family protein